MTVGNDSIERKNAARMVFVQALYGEHFGVPIRSAENWVELYNEERLEDETNPELEEDEYSDEVFQLKTDILPDMKFLRKLLRGWLEERAAIVNQLTEQLSDDEKRSFDRLSPLIQSVLCAGAYELVHTNNKAPVVLKEFTDIASGFFDNPELGFINGTLQEIANSQK
jgi:Transcription termination factor